MTEVIENTNSSLQVRCHRYNASRGGHAPSYLTAALVEALDDTFRGNRSWWEALNIEMLDPAKQAWWDGVAARQRASWLLGQLWNCSDILGTVVCSTADLMGNKTVAQLVRILKTRMVESGDL
jgi:hypothetical protein